MTYKLKCTNTGIRFIYLRKNWNFRLVLLAHAFRPPIKSTRSLPVLSPQSKKLLCFAGVASYFWCGLGFIWFPVLCSLSSKSFPVTSKAFYFFICTSPLNSWYFFCFFHLPIHSKLFSFKTLARDLQLNPYNSLMNPNKY